MPADAGRDASDSNAALTKEKLQALEAAKALPALERGPALAGIDANRNGIRDDVDTFIDGAYASPTQQAAARQFCKVMQDAILADKSDLAALKAISVRGSRSVNCLYARFDEASGAKPAAAVAAELTAISSNTKPRLTAYLAFSKALNGTAGSLPAGDTCE